MLRRSETTTGRTPFPGAAQVPDAVWARHRDALRARDVGEMFRLARQYAGASQQRLSAATGVPQSRISALMNDRSGPVTSIDVLTRIADGLQLPDYARMDLGLAPRHRQDPEPLPGSPTASSACGVRGSAPTGSARTAVSLSSGSSPKDGTVAGLEPPGTLVAGQAACDGEPTQGPRHETGSVKSAPTRPQDGDASHVKAGEDPTDRRQVLQLGIGSVLSASLSSLGDEPFDRLRFAVRTQRCDEATTAYLECATAELFTREEQAPAAVLREELARHVDLLARLIPTGATQTLRTRLSITAGEAAALAGWIAYDLDDARQACAYWQAALHACHNAVDGPGTALALGYTSYQKCQDGDHQQAHRLLNEAARHLRASEHATALAWITARQAEEAAHLRRPEAPRLLDRARSLMDNADRPAGRAWAGFFDHARLGAMTVSVHTGLPDLDPTVSAVLTTAREDAKTLAVILGDVATAYLDRGDLDRASEIGEQALHATVAGQAVLGRQRLAVMWPRLESAGHAASRSLADRIRDAL